jgi:hypothetical protein
VLLSLPVCLFECQVVSNNNRDSDAAVYMVEKESGDGLYIGDDDTTVRLLPGRKVSQIGAGSGFFPGRRGILDTTRPNLLARSPIGAF